MRPIQLERWVPEGHDDGGLAEISVIFCPDRGHFEIAYFEGRDLKIREGFIFSLEDAYKKLEEVRDKVDPGHKDGHARFVRRAGRVA